MPVRFNPPPGWQVPPGFRPDSAWAPDPSWPPAPPGWNYWVDLPAAPPHDQGAQDAPRPASAPTPPQPPASPPASAPGDMGGDTRTVAIQVVQQGLGTQAPAPQTGPPPVDELGSTMTMAPVSGPSPAAQRPGSGAQPVYPPQSEPPPPPEPPSKGPTTGVVAALKGLGSRKTPPEGTPARSGAQSRQGPGPVALSIDDSHADHGGPVHPAGVPAQNMSGPRPGAAASRQRSGGPGAGIMIAIAVAGLALGVIIGVIITAGQQAEANQAITDAQNVTSEIDESRAQIEADRELVDKQRDEVAEREQALGERERKVKEQEAALKQQQEQQEQQQQQQEQEQEQQEQEEDDGPGGGGHQNGTVFYWNCDAVRAAGAAPLSSNDPGYLPHLDQNGNGVACEGGE